MKKHGFTLIELLVVIAIIALLSSVVLGSLGQSRAKASNSRTNSMVLEYVKALELYRAKQGTYPMKATSALSAWYCLGTYSTTNCGAGSGSTYYGSANATLNQALDDYSPSLPPVSDRIINFASQSSPLQVTSATEGLSSGSFWSTSRDKFVGAVYRYVQIVSSNINKAVIIWALEGNGQNCARPANAKKVYSSNTSDGKATICEAVFSL